MHGEDNEKTLRECLKEVALAGDNTAIDINYLDSGGTGDDNEFVSI